MEATTLLKYYKRKLQTVTELISKLAFKDIANPDYIRLYTKANCYRLLITAL
jgi:hypothetical protein